MLRHKLPLLLTITLSTISIFPISSSLAQTTFVPLPSDAPLDLDLLTQPKDSVITANTINLSGLTTPSLWWSKENSENKLLDNWIAYPATKNEAGRVDLIVNQQIWSLLDYLERYDFVNRLGSTARRDGYNVRVFNYQKDLLGSYTCSYNPISANCNIQLNTQYKLRRYQ
ncbi:hypothetical protein [Nostoc parmelioides]|uniref:Uncharacterized protein n=1 Tax=Nostoc parmelioides FACHB-3921 TaxID=2692909 RepID=A0ABR8BK01_9NOSO|nr:hypothetical protein [Nostoc parmelioides]MBD2253989.1 hypothetical protein [Nostoc parmelioides FACHB-3921]